MVTIELVYEWATWVWIQILVALGLLVSCEMRVSGDVGLADVYEMVRHFRRDFQQLLPLAIQGTFFIYSQKGIYKSF